MPASSDLTAIYADEMKDLWSANDQMAKIVKTMAEKAHDPELKSMLGESLAGINKHTATLKSLIEQNDGQSEPEFCKGMEGLVQEARKHITEEAPRKPELLNLVILSQYQRMSHYGMAGFGTAAAYAKALNKAEHAEHLSKTVKGIYKADEFASILAQSVERQVT